MNVIIIAAIALLVLVILAVLLFNTGDSVQEGRSCASVSAGRDSECVPRDGSCPDSMSPNPAGSCSQEDYKCCTQLFG